MNLLPCPFCGGQGDMIDADWAGCQSCGGRASPRVWNSRVFLARAKMAEYRAVGETLTNDISECERAATPGTDAVSHAPTECERPPDEK